MQIALFNSSDVNRSISISYGNMKQKKARLRSLPREISSKFEGISDSKIFQDILGLDYDSHYVLEKLGLLTASRKYIIEIDISDCLDLILSILSGCKSENVRKMPNYSDVSRILLSADLDNFNISLGGFLGLDDNLDRYLLSISQVEESNYIETLLSEVYRVESDIIKYVGVYLQSCHQMVFRSVNKSKILLTTNENFEQQDLILEFESPNGKILGVARIEINKRFGEERSVV